MRDPIHRILVYTHSHRDRDCWPLVRALRGLGHEVYYALRNQLAPARVGGLCREAAFDLIVTSDRLLRSDEAGRYFLELPYQPRIYELIFNGLQEICDFYGSHEVDRRLERENASLLVMDEGLRATLGEIGIHRAEHLQYCISKRSILSPRYYETRVGLRYFGWISPRERAPSWLAVERTLARLDQLRRGRFARRRTFDVLFLGECGYGFDPKQIHELSRSYLDSFDEALLLQLCRRFEREFPQLLGRPIAEAVALRDRLAQSLALPQPGLALFKDYLIVQFRRYRRLQMLKRLSSHLGSRLVLFGDQLAQLGLPARNTDHAHADRHYLNAKVAVDFGSNIYDSTLYTRPAQIIASGACLLQLEQADGDAVLGADRARMTFATLDEMTGRMDACLAADSYREELTQAQRLLAWTTGDWDQQLERAVLRSLAAS
jgi:hypothetical protein